MVNTKFTTSEKPLHRTWVRLLPYTSFGALLISLKSAPSLTAVLIIYSLLMGVQLSAMGIYFLTSKLISKQ